LPALTPRPLRSHQQQLAGVIEAIASGRIDARDVLAAVTPGGGKSLLPVIAAARLIAAGIVERVCWIVPRDSLRLQAEEAQATVTRDPLPQLMADRLQVSRVLQNLLSNALRYRSDAVPRIDVDAAYQEIQAARAAIFDVRGPASYAARHAAGATLIPLDDIEQSPRSALALLPAGKRPILYCT